MTIDKLFNGELYCNKKKSPHKFFKGGGGYSYILSFRYSWDTARVNGLIDGKNCSLNNYNLE